MDTWAIHLDKEYFKFSCAHFLIFPDGSKERLHGHNYRVRVEIVGDLSERGLVIDFIEAKPVVRQLCDELDEHWLVPGEHPELKLEVRDDGHTEVVYREARYLVPSDELIALPINNTSPARGSLRRLAGAQAAGRGLGDRRPERRLPVRSLAAIRQGSTSSSSRLLPAPALGRARQLGPSARDV
jgi:6-pyruvoyltetrahydropterin/6-carboxytetrahydropterin synthase